MIEDEFEDLVDLPLGEARCGWYFLDVIVVHYINTPSVNQQRVKRRIFFEPTNSLMYVEVARLYVGSVQELPHTPHSYSS